MLYIVDMKDKYIKYIDYIVSDIKPPYFINMNQMYRLSEKEYELVLTKVYNQPVTIKGINVYDTNGNLIYREYSSGVWVKRKYDINGNKIYHEDSNGYWVKRKYDTNGNMIYREDSDGYWFKNEYDNQGNLIYREYSSGTIIDNR